MPRAAGKQTAGQDEGFIAPVSRFCNRSYAPDYAGFALLLIAYALVRLTIYSNNEDTDPCPDTSVRRALPPHVHLRQCFLTIPSCCC